MSTSEGKSGTLDKTRGPSTVQPGCVAMPRKHCLRIHARRAESGPCVEFRQNTAPVWDVVVGTCGTVRGGVAWKVKSAIARCWRSH